MQLRDELHGSRQPSYRGTSTKDADVSRAVCCRCTDVNACWQIKPRGDSHENAWTSDACGAPLQGLLIMECLLRWRHSSEFRVCRYKRTSCCVFLYSRSFSLQLVSQ